MSSEIAYRDSEILEQFWRIFIGISFLTFETSYMYESIEES
jgi:hypothetical protein